MKYGNGMGSSWQEGGPTIRGPFGEIPNAPNPREEVPRFKLPRGPLEGLPGDHWHFYKAPKDTRYSGTLPDHASHDFFHGQPSTWML